jgi:hypothetical protein
MNGSCLVTGRGPSRAREKEEIVTAHQGWSVLTYAYNLPTDEEKVEADAIMLAYLVVFQQYPCVTSSEGALNEQAYALCRRLRNHNSAWLTNDYRLFCRFFIAYFTAAYQAIVQQCNEDGGEMLRDLEALVDGLPHETLIELLRLLILQSVHQGKSP